MKSFLFVALFFISACNEIKLKMSSSKTIKGGTPSVSSASQAPSASGVLENGEAFSFTVNFTEPVSVSGTPRIPLTIGAETRYATVAAGEGTKKLVFKYVVASGDEDIDKTIEVGAFELNGGTIAGATGLAADLSALDFSDFVNMEVDGVPLSAPVLDLPVKKVFITGYRQEFLIPVSDANFHDNLSFLISSSSGGWGTSNITAGTNGKIVIASNAVPGTYSVNVVVDDGNGGTDNGSFDLIIEALGGTTTATSLYDSDTGCGTNPGKEFTCGFWRYTPTAYTTHNTEKFCALFYFHGNGGSGTGSLATNSLYEAIGTAPGVTVWEAGNPISLTYSSGKHYPCLVFISQQSGEWDHYKVKNALVYMQKNFRIDPDRIYVSGISYGGSGAGNTMFYWGQDVAAVAHSHAHNMINPNGGTMQPESVYHGLNYITTTQWSFHGEQDDTPWDGSARYTKTKTGINNSLAYMMNYGGDIGSAWTDGAHSTGLFPFEADPVTWLAGYNYGVSQKANRITVRNNIGHTDLLFYWNLAEFEEWLFSQKLDKGFRVEGPFLSATVVPDNVNSDVTLRINAKDFGGSLSKVFVDLTSVGGSNRQDLIPGLRSDWNHTFTVNAGTSAGTKILNVTLVDQEGHVETYPAILEVVDDALNSDDVIASYKVSFGYNDASCNPGADWNQINSGTTTPWVYYVLARKGRFYKLSEETGATSSVKLTFDFDAIDDQTNTNYNNIQGVSTIGDSSNPPAPFNAASLVCNWYTRVMNGGGSGYSYTQSANNFKFKIEGLNPGLKYTLYALGTVNDATQLPMVYTVTDKTGAHSYQRETNTTFSNTAKMLVVTNLRATDEGLITLKIDELVPTNTTISFGRINAFVLQSVKP